MRRQIPQRRIQQQAALACTETIQNSGFLLHKTVFHLQYCIYKAARNTVVSCATAGITTLCMHVMLVFLA